MKNLFAIAILFFISVSLQAQSAWTPEVMIKFKRVGGTDLSPDGKWVAYTISTPMMEGEKSEFLTHIWLASADGAVNMQFTQGDKSCTSPKFSPDGKYLAFLSSRGNDSKTQVWVMRTTGGEAEVITQSKTGVEQFSWGPHSKRIAYTQRDPDTEQEEKMKKEKRDWNIQDVWKYSHLYTVFIDKNAKGTRDGKRLTKGNFHVTAFDWSPDGATLAFSHQPTPSADLWTGTDISTVPADSGAVKSLVAMKGSDANMLYSPDGLSIAFVSDGGDPKWASIQDVYVVPAGGGQPKKLAETPDRNANIFRWSPDSKEIYFTETDRSSNRVFALPVSGAKPRALTTGAGTYGGASFSKDGKVMSFIHQTPEVAPEVFVSAVTPFAPKKLSDANASFPKLSFGKTEVIKWKSKDGKEIEGLLTYPVNYKAGRKYPLIMNIHGGPTGVFTQNFTAAGSVYPIQAFAQQGYAVLRPNPRGSSGYGKDFRFANYNDWGFGDYEDDQTGVDKVIEMGVAHADSLIICGWSYGGYMTSFTVTKTNRFKVASVGAGVTNLMSFNGTADIPSFLPDYFGGEFWDRADVYAKHSAMFNIKNVKTPSQVIHGERDPRVPPSQGFEFYVAMKRLGVPTEMITYPRTPHGPQEPKFIQDIGERMIAWFNKNLRKR
ncbi:MAG: S9 family peptidase [Cyclobacteriaceae bacterium]|nr:S9 family peptidase [Cyclobacteriaceae bacterium]